MDGRLSSLNIPKIRTSEDLEESMEELVKLNEEERFLFILTLLSQILPSRGKNAQKAKSCATEVTQSGAPERQERSADEIERQRSIVVSGLPEPEHDLRGQERMKFEWQNIWNLFDELEFKCSPVSMFRLGIPKPDRPRLLKLVLPTSTYQQLLLRAARKLRNSIKFQNVFIRPSLTQEERKMGYALRQQRRHLLETQGGRYRVERDSLFDLNKKIHIPLDRTFYPRERQKYLNVTRKGTRTSQATNDLKSTSSSFVVMNSSGNDCICGSCPAFTASTQTSLN
ncbi:hypothetical protein ANCDUO_26872 [Ancylostoma duodenale]|uniref:Uncharacterized protein n=1 Tax=Ancylostoma duodenale TaxID=51022 RepID=A0A0C2F894_9BILA|nr:hypothetical protein ANCDUO_26872 [Ancylostoma duodenale]